MIHVALKPVFPVELTLECIGGSKMGRVCIIVLYGIGSLDDIKVFLFMQCIAAASEAHASFSLFPYNPENTPSQCKLYIVLYTAMIMLPMITATAIKYYTIRIQEASCIGFRVEGEEQ